MFIAIGGLAAYRPFVAVWHQEDPYSMGNDRSRSQVSYYWQEQLVGGTHTLVSNRSFGQGNPYNRCFRARPLHTDKIASPCG